MKMVKLQAVDLWWYTKKELQHIFSRRIHENKLSNYFDQHLISEVIC